MYYDMQDEARRVNSARRVVLRTCYQQRADALQSVATRRRVGIVITVGRTSPAVLGCAVVATDSLRATQRGIWRLASIAVKPPVIVGSS